MVDHCDFQCGDNSTSKKNQTNPKNSTKNDVHYLNFGQEDQMDIQGFAFCQLKAKLCQVSCILTLGWLRLFFHWFPYLYLLATHKMCSLEEADKVLITDNYHKNKTYFIKSVKILESKETGQKNTLKYRLCNGKIKESESLRIIRCKKLTYIWDKESSSFLKLAGLQYGIATKELHKYKGLSVDDQHKQKIVYGPNEIQIPVQTVAELLVLEALTPFYIFQLFSLIVWLCEAYYYYGIAIVIMTVFGISSSIVQTRKNQQNLKGTVHTSATATVCRKNGSLEEISTSELVPGDVIQIPKQGTSLECDAVLLSGSCIVNESMLTGESVPVTKTPLPNNNMLYSIKEHMNHTLFCGTKVIQTRCQENECLKAVVVQTGYLTTKGELVRSILYPPPADFKFDQDSYKYIFILSCIATLGFLWTVVTKATRHIAILETAMKAIDIFTIVIPPALPAALTVGKIYALQRLKKDQIFCINSRVINVSGSVDCVCFDKTGTLTEDALDLWAVVPIENVKVTEPVKDVTKLSNNSSLLRAMSSCHTLTLIDDKVCGDPLDVKMFESTGSAIKEHVNLDDGNSSKYEPYKPLLIIRSPYTVEKEISILKQFQFSSHLQRMSVICKCPETNFLEIFCKGSPEKIISLSNPSSVPKNIFKKLKELTEQGYRVIGVGTKVIESNNNNEINLLKPNKENITNHTERESVDQECNNGEKNTGNKAETSTGDIVENISREDVEKDLEFIGLIVLENKLKPQTANVIKILKDADMKIVMITGDNVQTAITVAKESKIVDAEALIIEIETTHPNKLDFAIVKYSICGNYKNSQFISYDPKYEEHIDIEHSNDINYCFALTGENWANVVKYFPHLVPKIVTKGAVFARMSSLQKQEVIEALKKLGYYVAMCGDGSNDCSALKSAHVGISLSEAEASIASPFTSKEQNISCTAKVIKEGRAALVTSFGVFKIMLCYSLTEFTSTLILYSIDSNLSSLEFLYIDLVLILNFMFSFGRTKAHKQLAKKPPRTSILSFVPICSISLFMLSTITYLIFAFLYVQTLPWFTPFVYKPNVHRSLNIESYEGFAVFCVSMFQYITLTIVFSKGRPYRQSILTNRILLASLFLTTLLCVYITLIPFKTLASTLQLMLPPLISDRLFVLFISLCHFLTCYVIEDYFVQMFLEKCVAPKVTKSKKLYLNVIKDLRKDSFWSNITSDSEKLAINSFCKNEKLGMVNKGFVNSEFNTRL